MEKNISFIFPFFFIGVWILASFILSRIGWHKFAIHYKSNIKFNGKNIGPCSGFVNDIKFNNALNIIYNREGIYLSVFIPFRLFHPPLFIPWSEVTLIEDSLSFLIKETKLVIGNPYRGYIIIKTKTFEKMKNDYENSLKS